MAAFSSLGPTIDGRLKPDLMAPGEYIFSAKANPLSGATPPGYCAPLSATHPSVKAIMGTSMATPTLAGAAVLLRQWLVEGRYPDGFPKHVASVFTAPSGALVHPNARLENKHVSALLCAGEGPFAQLCSSHEQQSHPTHSKYIRRSVCYVFSQFSFRSPTPLVAQATAQLCWQMLFLYHRPPHLP